MSPDRPAGPAPAGAKQAARESTRTALLEAAAEMLFEVPAADVLRTLKPIEVARRTDPPRTTGAFYNIWPTQDDFRRDLLHHLLSLERFGADGATREALATLAGAPRFDLPETVRQAATINFDGNKDDPAFRLQLALWTRHEADPEVRAQLQHLYDDFTTTGTPLYEAVLERAGRRLRPPFTVRMLSIALTALGEGLTLRWAVDPEAVPEDVGAPPGVDPDPDRPWNLYATLTHVLSLAMTEPDD